MIINLKSQTDLSGFYVVYEGSTNLEKPGIYGISHLMEHLICKSFEHLREDFEREGIDWNAYTSSNEIVFYFTGLEEKLSKRKYEIMELISQFDISKEDFEKEKKIVLQEYSDTFSDQQQSHFLNLQRKMLGDFAPIGRKGDLESLRFMDSLNFFETQFSSPTKIINVSSKTRFDMDLDFQDRQIDRNFKIGPYNDIVLEKMNDYGDKTSLILMSPIADNNFNYISFINSMLSTGLSSPLYKEIREKSGLVYHIRCSQSRFNKQGLTYISTQTSEANVEKVYNLLGKIIRNPSKYMTQERFDTIKESYMLKYKKERINRFANVKRWIDPVEWTIYNILKTITLDKILEVYEDYFDFDKFYMSTDKKEFKK